MPWEINGNSGTSATQHFLGTTDDQAFAIRVNGKRALRIEPATVPNWIGGNDNNLVAPMVVGATIAGGGAENMPNRITASFGVIGGGFSNETAGERATVGGGAHNRAVGISASVPGGEGNNANGPFSFAAGRRANANHAGAFVWSDANDADFASSADNQFLIQAAGGVGIGTDRPGATLDIGGNLNVGDEVTASEFVEAGTSLKVKYQPLGNYQPAGDYLTTSGGSISGHLSVDSLSTPSTTLSSGLWLFNNDQQFISYFASSSNGGGYLAANYPNGKDAVVATTGADNTTPYFAVSHSAGRRLVQLGSAVWLFNNAERVVGMLGLTGESGFFSTYMDNGNTAVRLTTSSGGGGYLDVYNANGQPAVVQSTNTANHGWLETRMANGNKAVQLNTAGDAGFLAVYDSAGNAKHVLDGSSGTKHFVMPHPLDASKDIIYAAIEGPEAGAYWRGKATLQNGKTDITYPEHFALVINPETVTILLTPRSVDSSGLAIVAQSEVGFTVSELANGTGSYQFDFFVAAVRRGLEHYQPVVPKGASAFEEVLPSTPQSARPAPTFAPGAAGEGPSPLVPPNPAPLNPSDVESVRRIHMQAGES